MLTADQVCEYREHGYTILHGFLSASEVEAMLSDIDAISGAATLANHDASRMEMEPSQGPEGKSVRRLYEPCTHYPRFRSLSESKRLLDVAEQLVGPNLLFHYSKINMKPPMIGSIVEWHQDLTYYPLTNSDSVTVLFYLDDADSTNGCLKVIPNRHCEPPLDHTLNGLFQGRVTQAVDDSHAVFLEAKAGSAIFMHCLTPHASAPNKSAKSRRTLILSYRAADAFPIHLGTRTDENEAHVRLVRGEPSRTARFTLRTFPIPQFPRQTKSLYELQEYSRKKHEART
ncbi:MAG: phytanoyl-CoA dioxygenase family protein [Terriglobia bacterium]|jgi:ectoine hydroxylase-related dioxygenase (phytanoyl-CoA dioxygenase family)